MAYLDQRVSVRVPVDAKQQEPLPLLIITVVGVQNLTRTRVSQNTQCVCILCQQCTFFISAMISLGSLELVVFIDQVNRRERGLTSPDSLTTLLMVLAVLAPGVLLRSRSILWPWLPALPLPTPPPTPRLPGIPLHHNTVSMYCVVIVRN